MTALGPGPARVMFRDYAAPDRPWVAREHVRHYTMVEGFDPSFGEAVRGALDLIDAGREDPTGKFLIVEAAGTRRPVGCVFLMVEPPASGRLRLFYLDEAYRGRGIGKDMLDAMIAHAAANGLERIRVSTFDRHLAACRLYRAAGFTQRVGKPSVAFGQELRQVDFEKDLAPAGRMDD